jgi:hypothetical protein
MKKSIDGVDYQLAKIKVGQMLPLLPRFADEQAEVQREMVAACVHLNGEPLGLERVDDLNWGSYQELSVAVLEFNGFPTGADVGKS